MLEIRQIEAQILGELLQEGANDGEIRIVGARVQRGGEDVVVLALLGYRLRRNGNRDRIGGRRSRSSSSSS